MKIAILGDVHANLEALTAVLADLDAQSPDHVYCIGDVVGYGANPRECVAIVRERGWPVVLGNWEEVDAGVDGKGPDDFNPKARASVYWTRGALPKKDRDFVGSLPVEVVTDGLQFVHGSPAGKKTQAYVMPNASEDAEAAFAGAAAEIVFHGHTHVQIVFARENLISYSTDDTFEVPADTPVLANTGAVGQPRDGDSRARYCLFDTDTRLIEWRRCEYDIEKAAASILEAGLPEVLAERLRMGK